MPIFSMVSSLASATGLERETDFDPSIHTNSGIPDPNQPITVTISQFGQTLYPIAIDYSFRSRSLEHIPLYLYKRFLEKVPLSRAMFPFLDGHPQKATHGLRIRSQLVIPNIFFTIPSADSDDPVRKHTYASAVFIMFHPWRNLESDFGNFSHDAFIRHCPPIIAQLILNIGLLATSKKETQLLAALRDSERSALPVQVQDAFDGSDNFMDEDVADALLDLGTGHWTDSFSLDELDHSVTKEHDAFTQNLVQVLSTLSSTSQGHYSETPPQIDLAYQASLGPTWTTAFDTLACGETERSTDNPSSTAKSAQTTNFRRLEPYTACLRELGDRSWIHTSQSIIDRLRIDMTRADTSKPLHVLWMPY